MADANTPSKNPQEVVLNVLANDADKDTPKDQLVITGSTKGRRTAPCGSRTE